MWPAALTRYVTGKSKSRLLVRAGAAGSARAAAATAAAGLAREVGDRRLAGVGSGGGLPGLALKITRPDLAVTLIEADQAKAAFLVQACAKLDLRDVEVLARRAEEVGRDGRYRESFDVAVARALAPMR